MKFTSLAMLAMALQAGPPVKPAGQLDPRDPRSIVDHAIFNTRIQKCYETVYTARLVTNVGTIDYKGRSVWVAPGVLYVHLKATGNDDQKIVRAGDKDVWVHHSLAGWGTDAELGKVGAGRGIQNPDEVLSMLAQHTDTAQELKSGPLAVTFNGAAIANIMKGMIPGAINPRNSTATIELEVDEKIRIRKLTCNAAVAVGANISRYTSEVTVVAYNDATEIKFADERDQPIPLLPVMRDRIDGILNGKK